MPTSRFSSVDFPAFGGPTIATRRDLASSGCGKSRGGSIGRRSRGSIVARVVNTVGSDKRVPSRLAETPLIPRMHSLLVQEVLLKNRELGVDDVARTVQAGVGRCSISGKRGRATLPRSCEKPPRKLYSRRPVSVRGAHQQRPGNCEQRAWQPIPLQPRPAYLPHSRLLSIRRRNLTQRQPAPEHRRVAIDTASCSGTGCRSFAFHAKPGAVLELFAVIRRYHSNRNVGLGYPKEC